MRSPTKRKRRALVLGYDYHARSLASLINEHGRAWTLEAFPSTLLGNACAFARLASADALIAFGGPAPPPVLAIAAKRLGLSVIVQWAGSDVSEVLRSPLRGGLAARAGYDHLAVAPWLVDELRGVGICAELQSVAGTAIPHALAPFPERFAVMTYLPHPRQAFYGRDLVYEAARRMPHVPFIVVGEGARDLQAPANLEFHGYVGDVTALLDRSTLLLRVPEHDGMSRMVLEALARGRYVAWINDLPAVQRVTSADEVLAYMHELKARHSAHQLALNLAGRDYARTQFDVAEVAEAYETRLSQIADGSHSPRRERRHVVVSGLDLFVSQIAELAHEQEDRWTMNVMRFDTKLQVLASCLALAVSDAWYDIGNAAQNRWLELIARTFHKPRVIHWVGTDIALAQKDQRILKSFASGRIEHLAEVDWTIQELESIKIPACEAPLPPSIRITALEPLPARFTILCYAPAARTEFYGKAMYERLVRHFAHEAIRFLVVGGGQLDVPQGADVVDLGWVASLKSIYPEITVFVRLTPRDGLSLMVLEALAFGRFVVWGKPFPFVTPVFSYEALECRVGELFERHKAGTLAVQGDASAFICDRYAGARCMQDIVRAWDRAAEPRGGAAMPQAQTRAQPQNG